MRHLFVVVLFAACGHKGSDDAPPAPRPKLELLSCGPAREAFSATEGWGTIGLIGHGAGSRPSNVPTVSIGQPNAAGDLDKAIIRRYIRRNIQKIQYCYEKELLGNAALQGTLQTQFFIDPDGNVAAANGSGVDPKVADCVVTVIKSIQFPKPRGGGGVQVNYPFTFRPAGPQPPAPPTPDPALARQQAIQQARAAGIIAPLPNPIAQWTPFARMHRTAESERGPIDDSVADTVRGKLADVDRCFGTNAATGTARAMIDLGATPTVRVGGIGDAAIETCIAGALRGATYSASMSSHEIACDIVRGGDRTLRVSLGGGYTVIGATKAGVVYDGMPMQPERLDSLVMPKDRVALVVTEPDAPTPVLLDALRTAITAPATLVSVHGTGAPVLVGVEPAPRSHDVELWGGGVMRGCVDDKMLDERPALTDEKALAATLATWRSACGAPTCDLRVAVDSFSISELVTLAQAARDLDVGMLGLALTHECR